jgi:hypothetical protein
MAAQVRRHTHNRHAEAQPQYQKNNYHSVISHYQSHVVVVITTFIIAGYKAMFQ